jgi:hypothetical protein
MPSGFLVNLAQHGRGFFPPRDGLAHLHRSASVSLADHADGLPAFDGSNPERPATTMPTPGGVTRDGTIVRRSFSIPGPERQP